MKLRVKRPRPPPLVFDISKFINLECGTRYNRFLKIKWIMDKGFFDPPDYFNNDISRKGWNTFSKHPKRGSAKIVREFSRNLAEQEGYKVFIRGKQVSFDRHTINGFYQLSSVDDSAYQQLVVALDYDAIINCLTKIRRSYKRNNKNELVNFQTKHLTTVCRLWLHFVTSKISPSNNMHKSQKKGR